MMCGAIYCPLSPKDPKERLLSQIDHVNSTLVLVDDQTKSKFSDSENHFYTVNIGSQQNWRPLIGEIDISLFSNMPLGSDGISHIIFTSESIDVPKTV
ncbi:unnamed protein product, partial [Rotaria sp. Silwood1]